MPRFVLLRHECPSDFGKPSHWDFMLEWEGVLRTWELRKLPQAWGRTLGTTAGAQSVAVIPLPDHRLAYLELEGPLSGNRGSIECCDHGTYELTATSDLGLEFSLSGDVLSGVVQINMTTNQLRVESR